MRDEEELEEQPLRTASFRDMMADWFALTYVLNSLNRSVGMPDAYPFTLSSKVIEKLEFIHRVILDRNQAVGGTPAGAGESIAV